MAEPKAGRPVRIGIIGSGGIAEAHADSYRQIPEAEVVAVCDIVPGRAQAFIDRCGFQARAYDDHRKMLESDIDGVSICTFNMAHHQPTVDALTAGRHVLLEKPMAVTLGQAVEMRDAAERAGRILSIGFQSRYDPDIMLCKEIVDSGELGKIYYVETGGGRRRGIPGGTFIRKETAGGGAILDIGCYSIDTVMHALGNPKPLTVSATTSNYFGTSPEYTPGGWGGGFDYRDFSVEDFGVAFIRLEGGITFVFKIAWAMHMDTLGPTIFLGTKAGFNLSTRRIFHETDKMQAQTELQFPGGNVDHQFRKVETFAAAIRDGGANPVPAEEILASEAIIDGIYRSAEAGHEVHIEIPEL